MIDYFIIIFVGFLFIFKCGEPIPADAPDTYTTGTFSLEYDNQFGYDLFYISDFKDKINKAFDRGVDGAKTFVEFHINQSNNEYADSSALKVEEVKLSDLALYCLNNRILTTDKSRGVYPGYLVVIINIIDPSNANTTTGYSCLGGPQGWSVVGWNNCLNGLNNERVKVAIHELGHQRAALTDLCENRSNHDRDDCVMGQGIQASCTGKNLIDNPIFCPKCETALKSITW